MKPASASIRLRDHRENPEDEKRRPGREEKSTTLLHTPSPANACERASQEDGSECGKPSGVLRGHCELAPQVVDLAHSRSTPTRLTLSVSTSRRTAVHRNSPRHSSPSSPQLRGSDEVLRCPPWAENTSLHAAESCGVLRCPPWAGKHRPPCSESTFPKANSKTPSKESWASQAFHVAIERVEDMEQSSSKESWTLACNDLSRHKASPVTNLPVCVESLARDKPPPKNKPET